MVKDECDIIELFVRINSRAVDHFFILDNGSSDSTRQILEKLRTEGFSITLSSDTAIGHPQGEITTRLAREVAGLGTYDWIFPLDADEFIQADKARLATALAGVPEGFCAAMNWATFVPTSDQFFSKKNPLWSLFRQRLLEFRQYGKVIVPNALARQGFLTSGNHSFYRARKKLAPVHQLDIALAHVPARSSEQLASKAIIGSHKLSIKENRSPGEGFHWDNIADRIRENAYTLSFSAVKDIALSYGLITGDPVADELLPESRLGLEEDRIRYPELAGINLYGRYDAFMGALCTEIRSLQAQRKRKFPFFRWI